MPDPHNEPCTVEAHQREVVVECGATLFSLTPQAASDLGTRLVKEALAAERQPSRE